LESRRTTAYPGRKKVRVIPAPNPTISVTPMVFQFLKMTSSSGVERKVQIRIDNKNTKTKMMLVT
jgi:hypothetical protein